MASRFGWFPTRRDGIIHMADAWSEQLDLHSAEWGVPADTVSGFKSQLSVTKPLFAEVQTVLP